MTADELREKVAQTIDKKLDGDCGYGVGTYLADALMPVFADVWDEGFHAGLVDNPYRKADPS